MSMYDDEEAEDERLAIRDAWRELPLADDQRDWKPGDVANGHVLTQHGTWVPLPPAPQPTDRRRNRLGVIAGLVVGTLLLAHALGGPANDDLDSMTCEELYTELFDMTGVDATEDFDRTRAHQINVVLHEKDCVK